MKSSTGRWVSGDNFFNRTDEMERIEQLVRDGNHVLLTGQRRMGKTSVARMLGERLRKQGWTCLFTDVEAADSEEAVIAAIAEAVYPCRSIRKRLVESLGRQLGKMFGKPEEIEAYDFRIKFRAALTQGTWQRRGDDLVQLCARHDSSVLLVIDELPIFLTRLLHQDKRRRRTPCRRVPELVARCVPESRRAFTRRAGLGKHRPCPARTASPVVG